MNTEKTDFSIRSLIKTLLFGVLIISCDNSSSETKFSREVIINERADFEKVNIQLKTTVFEQFLKPTKITHTDDYIVVSDRATPKLMHLIRKSDLTYLGQFGGIGQGPKEVSLVFDFKRPLRPNEIIVNSIGDRRIAFFDLSNPKIKESNELNIQPDSILQYAFINSEIVYFEFSNQNSFISTPITKKEKFHEIDIASHETVNSWGTWEGMLEDPKTPSSITISVFQGQLRTNEKRSKFGYATIYWDFIEILDLDDNSWLRLVGPDNLDHNYSIDYRPGYPMHSIGEGNKLGYIDLFLGSELIFGLYSGMPDRGAHGREIIIFDYKGKPVKIIAFDKPVDSFNVDEANQKIYLLSREGENTGIGVYDYDF